MDAPIAYTLSPKERLEEAKLHAERLTMIGGSDVHHLMALEPFGCERRLWYDKTSTPADFPEPIGGNVHMRRGKRLEPIAADEYRRLTGRKLRPASLKRHPHYAFVAAHLDRTVFAKRGEEGLAGVGPGVFETKVPTSRSYQSIRSLKAAPLNYQLQTQWGMLAAGWMWGSISVFNPERMSTLTFDQLRDKDIIESLFTAAQVFWQTVAQPDVDEQGQPVNPYPRLNPQDRRCKTCPWRATCQGLGKLATELDEDEAEAVARTEWVEDESLADLVRLVLELRGTKSEAERAYKEVQEELGQRLLGFKERGQGVRTSAGLALWKTVERSGYTVKPSTSTSLRVIAFKAEDADDV